VNNFVVPNGLLDGIHMSGNDLYFIGGSIVLTGSTNDALNVYNDGPGRVFLSGVHLENHPSLNMGQNSYYLVGDVVVDGHPYSDALPPGDGGSPVYLTDGFTTWNGDVTNAPSAGALMSVQATGERVWTTTLSVGGPGVVTNNGAVWYVTNNVPSIAMPKGSLASDTLNGDLYVNHTGLTNGWVKK
jgi:hypothetical protein